MAFGRAVTATMTGILLMVSGLAVAVAVDPSLWDTMRAWFP